MKLTTGHLFAGGGGDAEGSQDAGYTPLWLIENNKYAAAVLRNRFPNSQVIERDVTAISDEFIRCLPVPSAFIFGSPCTDISIAGGRAGLKGDHSSLFFEGVRFLSIQQPPVFVFENVRHLLSCNDGEDFKSVIRAFAEVGYVGSWQLRNGNRHVPQNRERIFVVGIHRRYSHISLDALQAIVC